MGGDNEIIDYPSDASQPSRAIQITSSKLEREDSQREEVKEALESLEKAVKQGLIIRGFCSGGMLRVVRIEDPDNENKLVGYGEHPNIAFAFVHAGKDFTTGHRSYQEQYGGPGRKGLHEHNLIGSAFATRPLDEWLKRGHKFRIQKTQEGMVLIELTGTVETEIPQGVMQEASRFRQKPIIWTLRGHTYETVCDPNERITTKVISSPEGKNNLDAWMYKIVKKGEGKTIPEALQVALDELETDLVD